ncbi:hypothetical protein HNW13_018375 [Shewanella sp. BF02_Schw]|uniref:hypothetical protein n=1 Tax=Shewanella sp. BF02_Schw TaxID=394908 RepID=UPI00177BAC0D|nr:hypothetical protein [Shewanella sp. BF02_Schw]MBO1897708.1 hypothetical protein [Shewanella sp. BF02_Schw]
MYNTINSKLEPLKAARLRDMYKFEKGSSVPEEMKICTLNSYVVTTEKIYIEDGFNIRDLNEDHVENFRLAYEANKIVPQIIVKVVLNEETNQYICVVREGHHRFVGGCKAGKTEFEVTEFQGDAVEEVLLMFDTANALPLNQLDWANGVSRLRDLGLNNSEIGRHIKKSSAHVGHLFDLLNMPSKLKDMVRNNLISATYARELFKDHGPNVMKVIASIDEEEPKAAEIKIDGPVDYTQQTKDIIALVGTFKKQSVDIDPRLETDYKEVQPELDIAEYSAEANESSVSEHDEQQYLKPEPVSNDSLDSTVPSRVTKKVVSSAKTIPKSISSDVRMFIIKLLSQLNEHDEELNIKIDDEDYLTLKRFEDVLSK